MDRRLSRKVNPRRNRRLGVLTAALVSLIGSTLPARFVGAIPPGPAETAISLPEDRGIGVLYVAGPFDSGQVISPKLLPGHGVVDGSPWRAVYRPSGIVDWGLGAKVQVGRKQEAVVGTWLRAESAFDGWLLVSADGAYGVAVDGRWVFRRNLVHPRGHGVDPIPIQLSAGRHALLVRVESSDNRRSLSMELRDRLSFTVPSQIRVELPQRASGLDVLSELVQSRFQVDAREPEPHLRVELSFPIGAPTSKLPVEVTLVGKGKTPLPSSSLGDWDLELAPRKRSLDLGSIAELAAHGTTELIIKLGGGRLKRPLTIPQEAVECVRVTAKALAALPPQGNSEDRFDVARATIEYRLRKLEDALNRGDAKAFESQFSPLKSLAEDILSQRPLFRAPGWHEVALRSPYDLAPQSVFIQIPAQSAEHSLTRFPLVVTLHGYEGNPRRILEAFLDHPGPEATVAGYVIAPEAHGNSFYRGAGEGAVFDAIDWATQRYPIAQERISITGVSMGGTGAAELAFRASERFAAAAPLCGYQSFLVRRDTRGQPLRPWEQHLIHQFSPASWAESGHDVPLYVAHGTLDLPLENSRVLTERYRRLGYSLQEDWPNLGHAVWKKTYRGGGLFPWLTEKTKDRDPRYLSLTVAQLRHGRKFWLSITDFEPSAELAHVDVDAQEPTRATIHTRSVTGFCLGTTTHLDSTKAITVTIDDQRLDSPGGAPRCFDRSLGSWSRRTGEHTGVRKRPYLEGPWSDLLAEPVVVVYGTQNPQTAELNRYVATRLFGVKPGVTLNVPVVSDEEYARRTFSQPRAVYVGRPDDHLQYGKVAPSLPVRVEEKAIVVGSRQFTEPDVGTVFVYPDPDRRERLVGFVSANGPEGLLRALALPMLVPDFMVFDREIDGAAAAPILGRSARVRAAGFFRSDWALPEDFTEPRPAEAFRVPR
jgi:hypothetical protein